MNVVEPGSRAENILMRAKDLIVRPVPTWEIIDGEEATIEGLYRSWVLPLAAVPAVCQALGWLAFRGGGMFGIRFHVNVLGVLTQAAVSYVLTLVGAFVMAVVLDELAIRFGGERSRTQAFKLVAYSACAAWLGGVFLLLPGPGFLLTLLAGVYSLYLLYLGLPKLMRSDPDQTLTYFAMALLVMVGVGILMAILSNCATRWSGPVSIY